MGHLQSLQCSYAKILSIKSLLWFGPTSFWWGLTVVLEFQTWLQTPRWAPSELGIRARTSTPETSSNLSKGTSAPPTYRYLCPPGTADWVWSALCNKWQEIRQKLEAVVALALPDHPEATGLAVGRKPLAAAQGFSPTCAPVGQPHHPAQGSMERVPAMQS